MVPTFLNPVSSNISNPSRRTNLLTPYHIPIIAVTASAMDEDRERCMKAGVDDIIFKPIDARILSEKLNSLLNPQTGKRVHFG